METTGYNHIREWLMPQLDKLGMSVEMLAQRAGISRATIYHYLTDRNRPDEDKMIKICHVLGVPIEEGLRQYTPRKQGRRPYKVKAYKRRRYRA